MLTDARLNEYQAAVPNEWTGNGDDLQRILAYVQALKENIDAAITNLSDALR